jgi:hypothetical protein
MRSSLAFGFALLGSVAAVIISCGGSNPPAKTGAEGKDESPAATSDKAEDTNADKAAGDDKAEPAASAAAPAESKCPFDLDKPATSKSGTVKIVTGCVSAEKSLKLIEQYFPQLHACFTAEYKANPKSKGEVNIKIMVGQNGTYSVRLSKMEVTSDEFVKCMIGVLEPLPYPKPEYGGATLEYTTKLK